MFSSTENKISSKHEDYIADKIWNFLELKLSGLYLKIVGILIFMSIMPTHYYNSNLIWRTVSQRVDEVIVLDHPRRKVYYLEASLLALRSILMCIELIVHHNIN